MTPTPFWEQVAAWLAGEGAATIAAAIIGALVVVIGYATQQDKARRERRSQVYSEALRAVEDYMEAPFLIRRRDDSSTTRLHITNHLSDVQSRIAYFQAELAIYGSSRVASGYLDVVQSARKEAGPAMTAAWRMRPTRRGRDVPIHRRYSRAGTDATLKQLIKLMRADVRRS